MAGAPPATGVRTALRGPSRARASRNRAADGRSRGERFVGRFIPGRAPDEGDYRLTVRNIYVLPSGQGVMLAVVLLVMLVCSINYNVALGYALSFLLFGVCVIGLLHTFRNLASLTLRAGRAEPAFAGGSVDIVVQMFNPSGLDRYAVRIDVPEMTRTETVDVPAHGDEALVIALPAPRRGWMPLPRITVSGRYPLGIWRAWSYWQPKRSVLVYPRPEAGGIPLPATRDGEGDGEGRGDDQTDLAGVRPFRMGDSPRVVAWTAMARTGGEQLLSKMFEGTAAGELLLDIDSLPAAMDVESRLSRLTRWALDAEQQGLRYGLALGRTRLAPEHGPAHLARCLEALALFGSAESARPGRRPAP